MGLEFIAFDFRDLGDFWKDWKREERELLPPPEETSPSPPKGERVAQA
jgi:hypothetical protein